MAGPPRSVVPPDRERHTPPRTRRIALLHGHCVAVARSITPHRSDPALRRSPTLRFAVLVVRGLERSVRVVRGNDSPSRAVTVPRRAAPLHFHPLVITAPVAMTFV
jgi:hypothetical protein